MAARDRGPRRSVDRFAENGLRLPVMKTARSSVLPALACACAAFDGSSGSKNKAAFVRCVRAVARDASDGTPIDGRLELRPQCKGTVLRIARQSDCGFAPAADRHPCCQHVT